MLSGQQMFEGRGLKVREIRTHVQCTYIEVVSSSKHIESQSCEQCRI